MAKTILRRSWLIGLCLLIGAPIPVQAVDINSLGLKVTYDVNATFYWNNRGVSVDSTANVTNSSNSQVSVIAFNLQRCAPATRSSALSRSMALPRPRTSTIRRCS